MATTSSSGSGHQPWCNGNIGMFGTSYPAYTQVAPAQYRSPYVKALIPVSAQSDNYGSVWASDGICASRVRPASGRRSRKRSPRTNRSRSRTGTSSRGCFRSNRFPDMTGGVRSQFLADVIAHDSHDAFWKAMSIRDKYAEMDVPAFHVTGWFDDLSMETQTNFIGMSQHARRRETREAVAAPAHRSVGPRRTALSRTATGSSAT